MASEINDRLLPADLETEMKTSFISYAMAVIINRALPDVRDGLKPVHRRILYDMKPMAGEGYLTKMRATAVCEQSFAEVARELELGKYLKLGKGEAQSGGADKASSLADCFESVVAAVYFDGGFDAAFDVVTKNLTETIRKAVNGEIFLDYKSRLLEIAQMKGNQHEISFKIIDERGPAHNLEFECAVYADEVFLAKACGHSKKEAEQLCAKAAIDKYNELFHG